MSTSEATLATILTAAEGLFAQNNYADVSMRDIAEAAAVSTGALYHHFPSKEKLYFEMITAYLTRLRQATIEATPFTCSCRERLRRLTRMFLSLPVDQRNLMRLVRRDINVFKGPMRDRIIRAYQEAAPNLVEAVLVEGMQRGEIGKQDARWLAWVFVAVVETTLTEYAEEKLGDVDARLDAALDLFFDGMSQRP